MRIENNLGAKGSATPQWLFDLLDEQVQELTGKRFQLDAAASDWNAKCEKYFDEEVDALQQDWSPWQPIFLNPPFAADAIGQFVEKAIEAAQSGTTVVLLVPSWPGYEWFQKLKLHARIQDVVGPIRFENEDGSSTTLNNGYRTSPIVIATLGPHVVAGTNGSPIHRPSSTHAPDVPRSEKAASRKRTKLLSLAEIEPREVEWLWQHRIPLGELTILDGDPSVNKSSFTLDLAARVSTGREMPDGTSGVSGGVVALLGEDSLDKTIVQRLTAAGADLERITTFEGTVMLPYSLEVIEEAIEQTQAKLLLIDPLMAFLACDANGEQKVRRALTPLKAIADRTNCAVLMVRHLTKRGGKHSLYRGSGSIGIVAATRSALLIGKSPEEPNFRILCHTKSNLGPLAPSLLFEPVDLDGSVIIEWRGECDFSADDLLTTPSTNEGKLAEAMSFLASLLEKGSVPHRTIKAKAVEEGIALRTLDRAKEILDVVSERTGFGPGGKWLWKLPD